MVGRSIDGNINCVYVFWLSIELSEFELQVAGFYFYAKS